MVLIFSFKHQQQGEESSMILGDKLQQKMDAVTFTQERMKRQIEDLIDKQDKVRVSSAFTQFLILCGISTMGLKTN